MKITYDKKSDAMYIYFKQKAKVWKTVKVTERFLVDFDKCDKIIGVEILEVSSQISKKQILSTIKTGVPMFA